MDTIMKMSKYTLMPSSSYDNESTNLLKVLNMIIIYMNQKVKPLLDLEF